MKTSRTKFVKIFFAAASLVAALTTIFAARPPFKIYTTADGLAHDSVNKIVRDSRGFLWFCTAEGLSRFDGSKFKNYTQDQGLPHRNVNDFLETQDGTYLVGTSLGLSVFNPHGKVYRWNVLEAKLERTSDEPPLFQTFAPDTHNRLKKNILSLAQDHQGRIWAGTASGLFRVEKVGAQWRFQEIEIEDWKDKDVGYPALLADSKGGLLIGAGYGIYRISPDGQLAKVDNHGSASILEDREGKVWVDGGGNFIGLRVFEYENGTLKLAKTFTRKDGLTEDAFYYALIQTSDGRIFVGIANGLCEFLPDAKENEPKFRVLNTEKVSSLAEDSGGNLWFGTEVKGAWKLVRSGFTSFGEADGILTTDGLGAIFTNENSEIFIPSNPHKILHLADGEFESVLPLRLTKRSWGWHFLDFQAQDGEWWIPAIDGLRRYPKVANFADLARTPPRKIYTTADGLSSNEIFNIFEDSRGDVWVSVIGAEEGMLARWERTTDKIISYNSADGLPTQNSVISFAVDSHGSVWFGHYYGGLARYRDGKFQFFTAKDGVPESQIDDLLTDSSGRLCIATTGRGLFRIDNTDEEKPVLTSISTVNGLSSNQILCLTEDRFKRIYAGTGRGINRLDPNGSVKIYTQDDGLPSNYITRCAADKNGALWFVTSNTLERFVPEIEQTSTPPPVLIDKISINGVPQKISELGETEVKPLELASDQRQIQIDFFALTFSAGENLRYQYRLDEQDWSSPTEQHTLNLDLSSGQHNFAVRAVHSDGMSSENPARASFKILSPIWLRWWFIALMVSFAFAVFYLFYRYRTARLREVNLALAEAKRAEEDLRKSREERLAELERVRARIATDLHDDIGASLTQIAILSEVARQQNKSGNVAVAEPLIMISNVSNELVGTMSDIVWAINPQRDHLRDLTQRMLRFASDDLSAKGINFEFDAPELESDIPLGANLRREVFLIFKESLNNIVKHSNATQVEIAFSFSYSHLTLNIADNGSGFAVEKITPSLFADERGGNGLFSMQRRAGEMGGLFNIKSEIGAGTTVTLNLPLEQNQKEET